MPTLTGNRYEQLKKLINRKEKELGASLVQTSTDTNGNVHLLMKKRDSPFYIVWSTFNTGEHQTTYSDFYKGQYYLTYQSGRQELARRCREKKS